MNEELQGRVDELLSALRKNYVEFTERNKAYYGFESLANRIDYELEPGKKYIKIVQISLGGSRSVHAFVEKATGALLKAASWRSPAKGVRYSLLDDASFAQCLERADWAGGYLYKR